MTRASHSSGSTASVRQCPADPGRLARSEAALNSSCPAVLPTSTTARSSSAKGLMGVCWKLQPAQQYHAADWAALNAGDDGPGMARGRWSGDDGPGITHGWTMVCLVDGAVGAR